MKISLPFFVFETITTINSILRVVFREGPRNNTVLRDTFVPRRIETVRLRPGTEEWAVRIKMWADGVYVDATSEGFADSCYGNKHYTTQLQLKVRLCGFASAWVVVDVPVRDIMQAEKNHTDGIAEDNPRQIAARKRQAAALKVIHDLLATDI